MAREKTSPKHFHYDYLRTKRGRAVPWADSKTIAEGLLLASPGELADDVKRFQVTREHPQTDPGYSVLEFILRSLEKDAKTILNKKHSEGVQVEPAEDFLMRSMEIRNAIERVLTVFYHQDRRIAGVCFGRPQNHGPSVFGKTVQQEEVTDHQSDQSKTKCRITGQPQSDRPLRTCYPPFPSYVMLHP